MKIETAKIITMYETGNLPPRRGAKRFLLYVLCTKEREGGVVAVLGAAPAEECSGEKSWRKWQDLMSNFTRGR